MALKKSRSIRGAALVLTTIALGWTCSPARSQATAPSASRYVDSAFGFSFWYPSAWKLTDEPIDTTSGEGWFRDARIVKILQIKHSVASSGDEESPGVIIQELVAPKGLTELGQSMSASPVGVDQRYFFDRGARRWMYAQLSEGPDGTPPATQFVAISQRTMGGLPVFPGAVRHGAEVIVPLNESHFLTISTLDPGGDNNHVYVAKTVMATALNSGKKENTQAQTETVRREVAKLEAKDNR